MPATTNHTSVEKLNQANEGKLPGHLGLEIVEVADGKVGRRGRGSGVLECWSFGWGRGHLCDDVPAVHDEIGGFGL